MKVSSPELDAKFRKLAVVVNDIFAKELGIPAKKPRRRLCHWCQKKLHRVSCPGGGYTLDHLSQEAHDACVQIKRARFEQHKAHVAATKEVKGEAS